ncbi:MAG: PAAR domain-containing protein [Neisseriaceae bacterium]|nr:PAAR domain-containing protein [Neisseriaceae bacterium]MBP6863594.1 PAAR domain-containing protein [Neisseriaceae bacterium]
MSRAIICVGDTTTHGGQVLEGDGQILVLGRAVARVGDRVRCPKCKGVYVIVEGDPKLSALNGQNIALEGMQTSCGARLISSQTNAKCD